MNDGAQSGAARTQVERAVPSFDATSSGERVAPQSRGAPRFRAVGFWSRLASGTIDALLIVPIALALAWVVGKILGFGLPPSLGLDYWLDLLLGNDPSMVTVVVILLATASIYLLIFQATVGRTLGMRLLGSRVINLYGEAPDTGRAALRTIGALVCVATLGLGFLWVAFDAEKRGLHDWIAGTYVVRG